jgi:hypothetical protein
MYSSVLRIHCQDSHTCCSLFRFLCNLIVCFFSFDHCIVIPSSSYYFWIPLCYLQSFPLCIPLVLIDVKQLSSIFNAFRSICDTCRVTIDSVAASLPVVTLYQIYHIRSHKFKNMRSVERYKLHMCFLCNLIVWSFSFDHCIVLPSSSYYFWIPLCYLQSFPPFIPIVLIDFKQLCIICNYLQSARYLFVLREYT